METLRTIYIAMAVFGFGVTLVDLFGALDHIASDDSASGHTGHADGHAGQIGDDDGHVGEVDANAAQSAADEAIEQMLNSDSAAHVRGPARAESSGSLMGAPSTGLRRVSAAISTLRTIVYFALGAGATGLFGLWNGLGVGESLLWSAGAGLVVAFGARVVRRVARHDLDSSFNPEDFILEEAAVTVPLAPGMMGKIIVRRYGAELELFARARDPAQAFVRGDRVRVIDYSDECYVVEAADEEHLVH